MGGAESGWNGGNLSVSGFCPFLPIFSSALWKDNLFSLGMGLACLLNGVLVSFGDVQKTFRFLADAWRWKMLQASVRSWFYKWLAVLWHEELYCSQLVVSFHFSLRISFQKTTIQQNHFSFGFLKKHPFVTLPFLVSNKTTTSREFSLRARPWAFRRWGISSSSVKVWRICPRGAACELNWLVDCGAEFIFLLFGFSFFCFWAFGFLGFCLL